MTQRFEMYRCSVCGNIVEVAAGAPGKLVCCGKPMDLLIANTTDAAQEKHVPVYSKEGNVVTIKVGSVPHPMTEEHFIEWIEIHSNNRTQIKFLKPGDAPTADFCCPPSCEAGAQPIVRAYCNLHGLWECRPQI